MDFATAKASFVIIISSSSGNSRSCSSSSGVGSSSGSDSTSSCGSSSKILSWTGKYKLGAIARVRASKCNVSVKVGKHKLGVRTGTYKLGARTGKSKLGARARAGGQAKGRGREIQTPLARSLCFLTDIFHRWCKLNFGP